MTFNNVCLSISDSSQCSILFIVMDVFQQAQCKTAS